MDGWEDLKVVHRAQLAERVKEVVFHMKLPYNLHRYGWIFWWSFDRPELAESKEWFDGNAAIGEYPEMKSYHPERKKR